MGRKKAVGAVNPADHLGLVGNAAKRYAGRGISYDDLFQEGCVGLIIAVRKFKPEMGNAFSTYAGWWISSAMGRLVDNAKAVKLTLNGKRKGVEPLRIASLDKVVAREDGEIRTLLDLLPSEGPDAFEFTEAAERRRIVREAITLHLTPRQNQCVRLRLDWGLDNKQIGEQIGLSRERVRQIFKDIFEALRPRLERAL